MIRTGDDGVNGPAASGMPVSRERLAHTSAGASSTISTPSRTGEEPCGDKHVAMEGIDPSMAFQARRESNMTCVVRTCVELADDGDDERDRGAVNEGIGPKCARKGRRHWRLTGLGGPLTQGRSSVSHSGRVVSDSLRFPDTRTGSEAGAGNTGC